eukprot:12042044-Alexandrium_andersonii.AAC.1
MLLWSSEVVNLGAAETLSAEHPGAAISPRAKVNAPGVTQRAPETAPKGTKRPPACCQRPLRTFGVFFGAL